MKKSRVVLLVLGVLVLLGLSFFTMTGLYVDPPVPKKDPGSTVWFYRRLIKTPFLFSADSIALSNGAVPTEELRAEVSRNVSARLSRHVLARFPFSRTLYMATTGNRDFLTPQEEGGDK